MECLPCTVTSRNATPRQAVAGQRCGGNPPPPCVHTYLRSSLQGGAPHLGASAPPHARLGVKWRPSAHCAVVWHDRL